MWLALGQRSFASVTSHRFLESHAAPKIVGRYKGSLALTQFSNPWVRFWQLLTGFIRSTISAATLQGLEPFFFFFCICIYELIRAVNSCKADTNIICLSE